ncbi:hypothetical protein DRN93_02325 [archaeon]|nr:MAG: hypothetical protein DRN93_02325 [archaeon]
MGARDIILNPLLEAKPIDTTGGEATFWDEEEIPSGRWWVIIGFWFSSTTGMGECELKRDRATIEKFYAGEAHSDDSIVVLTVPVLFKAGEKVSLTIGQDGAGGTATVKAIGFELHFKK